MIYAAVEATLNLRSAMGKVHSITKSANSRQKDITKLSDLELIELAVKSIRKRLYDDIIDNLYRNMFYTLSRDEYCKYAELADYSDKLPTSRIYNRARRHIAIILQILAESKDSSEKTA
jgi:hypothetical protein